MSAGKFISSKYQGDGGGIHRIRIQPETAAATFGGSTNTAPSAAVNQPASARARGGKRKIGVTARTFTLMPVGEPPEGYKPDSPLVVPCLTPTLYNATNIGATATYLDESFIIVGKSPERVR